MTKATIGSAHYQLSLVSGTHEYFADEPKNVGGTDMAPAPDHLLEASLASCTAITLRMYADRKQWAVEKILVEVTVERVNAKTIFTRTIQIEGAADNEQKERLLQIAKACPVSKSLLGEIEINSTLQ